MFLSRYLPVLALALLGGLAMSPAMAAESYENCAGFIDSLPATISRPGTWCLRKNLATGISSGNAVTIASSHVTLDCNDFQIDGLAAGASTDAHGIQASFATYTTVRRCGVRGFAMGIRLDAGGSNLVEDNHVQQSFVTGIYFGSLGGIVRRNRVVDTGGRPDSQTSTGIFSTGAAVVDNTVDGLFPNGHAIKVWSEGPPALVRGNRIRNMAQGIAISALSDGDHHLLVRNQVANSPAVTGRFTDIYAAPPHCRGNDVAGLLSGLGWDGICGTDFENIVH